MDQTQIKIWTRADIQQLLARNDEAVKRAIVNLYQRQTASEQAHKETRVQNGVGFNARDAEFLTDIAQKLPRYNNNMTPKQLAVARKMLPKYWKQLLEVIEEKGGQVDYRRDPLPAATPAQWGLF